MARDRTYVAQVNIIGANVINDITRHIREISDKSNILAKRIAEKICERAQLNLKYNIGNDSYTEHYNTDRLLDNIYVKKYKNNSYRVAIRENADKEVMYFLEFGTGLVGKEHSHEWAGEFGYQYAKNVGNYVDPSVLSDDGYKDIKEDSMQGWIYFDKNKQKKVFTSGLYPVAYLYDTMQELEQIVEEAMKEVGL